MKRYEPGEFMSAGDHIPTMEEHSAGDYVEYAETLAVARELINGLNTDGGHHKQYAIEQALRLLCGDLWVEGAKKEYQWEDGIPS